MKTVWGIVAMMSIVALAASCGTEKKDAEQKTRPENTAAPKSLVKADDVTSERGAKKEPEIKPEPEVEHEEPKVDESPSSLPAGASKGLPTSSDEPTLVKKDGLSLASIVLARAVEKRKPVDRGTTFKAKKGVFLYTIVDAMNPEREETFVTISWRHAEADKEIGGVKLKIKDQEKWRTWAKTGGVTEPGQWVAIVRDENGEELGRAPFTLTEK